MAGRVDALVEAYFNQTLQDYSELVSAISMTGGLTPEEVAYLSVKVPDVDAWTIVRHAGVFPRAVALGVAAGGATGGH